MGWIEYWDDKPTIYVDARHKAAHYRWVADGLIANLGAERLVVLDYGCGEAIEADRVAGRCRRLYLCDAAPSVRAELTRRFAEVENISVVSPGELSGLPAGSVDLVVANSVVQYLDPELLSRCLDDWTRLLSPSGRLLIADVVPRSVGPLTDALALLRFGYNEGFFLSACLGLARTFFSNYRKIRAALGLQQFEEAEMIALLRARGLDVRRHRPNLGHNQNRMAFVATWPSPASRATIHPVPPVEA
jgi:SAM-dependent methyltransferase